MEDLMSKCRLCLRVQSSDGVNIFVSGSESSSYSTQLTEMFPVEIKDLPDWPCNACEDCVNKLELIKEFKETVISSQSLLCIQTVKVKCEGTSVKTMEEGVPAHSIEEVVVKGEMDGKDSEMEDMDDDDGEKEEERDCLSIDETSKPKKKYDYSKKLSYEEKRLRIIARSDANKTKEEKSLEKEMIKMGILTCKVCQEECLTLAHLFSHVQDWHEDIKYVFCCNRTLATRDTAFDHIRFHLNPNEFKCTICGNVLQAKRNLITHMKKFHPKEEDEEAERFKKSKQLKPEAMESNEKEKSLLKKLKKKSLKITLEEQKLVDLMHKMELLKCHWCPIRPVSFFDLLVHTLEAHNEKGFIVCCDNRLATKRYAYDHMRWHLDNDAFKCETCGIQFKAQINLYGHKLRVHTEPDKRKFICPTCGQGFSYKSSYRMHLAQHLPSEERPFKCQYCARGFSRSCFLASHIHNVHDREKNFVCQTCGKTFPHKDTLSSHMLQMHDPAYRERMKKHYEKMTCELCGKTFGKIYLKRHRATSCFPSGTEFSCDLCDKVFPNRRRMSNHRVRSHKDVVVAQSRLKRMGRLS